MSENLFPQTDLNDPATLFRECSEVADGMDAQANAARAGGAVAGHPYPDQFYGRVAMILRAAATRIRDTVAPVASGGVSPSEPAPASSDAANANVGGKKAK